MPDQVVPDVLAPDTCSPNGCGGCVALSPPLGSACGLCGKIICDGPTATKCQDAPPAGAFGAPTVVAAVNTSDAESAPDISADKLELFFTRSIGSVSTVYVATRTAPTGTFGTPTAVAHATGVLTGYTDPSLSADGLTLYLKKGENGLGSIYYATRSSKGGVFTTPNSAGGVNVQNILNLAPDIASDANTLHFSSNRAGGPGSFDIYQATRVSGTQNFFDVKVVPTINSNVNDGGPTITGDGLSLIFFSYRSGGAGGADLWISTRTSAAAAWSAPVTLPGSVNSSAEELEASISADGSQLYFQSNRGGGAGGMDIWQSIRACN